MNQEKMSKAIQDWTRASSRLKEELTSEELAQVMLTWLESASPETLDLMDTSSNSEEEEAPEGKPSSSRWLKDVLKFSAKTFLFSFVAPPAIYALTKRVKGIHIATAPCGCGGTNFSFISQRTGLEMFGVHVGGNHIGEPDPGDILEDPGPKSDDEPEPEDEN